MRRVAALVLSATLMLLPGAAFGKPAPGRIATLARGISLTGWFRFPASADPAALRAWLSDSAMADLRRSGFSFVRLAVQPEALGDDPRRQAVLVEAIRRLQHQGLAVVIDAHPSGWNLEQREADRRAWLDFWRRLAPALRALPPGLTFPELLNEPVFTGQDAAWQALQHAALGIVRATLPDDTVVLTGDDWGSVAGLLRLRPEADPNVIYSFHFYDPAELTSLAAYRADVRHADLAKLPFPVDDPAACRRVADASPDPPTAGLMRFYCSLGWDGAKVAARIEAAAEWGRRNHAAVWLGEFGASARLNPPARLAWLRTVREACAARGIGWALWGYDDVMGFGVPRPPGPHPVLDRDVLRALGLGAPG
ncbi:MAG TPA: cellulase family glycosylhydrolase [Acetobacteraceae bacterium]